MNSKPTYDDLLKEIEQLKQRLEEQQKLKNEQELSLAKEKAEKSERLFRRLIENAPWGMHFYKLENDSLIFTGANRTADKLLHVDNSQFIGKTIEEAFPPLVQTEIPLRYREAAEKGYLWKTEQISYDDNKISGAFEVVAFQTSRGNMVAAFNDITGRKQHEEQLKKKNEEYQQLNNELIKTNSELVYAKQCIEKSEERFQLILRNSNDTFVLVNKNGEQFYISDVAERDTGFTIDELKGPIQNVIFPPDLDIVLQAWEKILNTKNGVVRVQYRHKHKHKEYIWYEAAAQNHLDHPAINAVVVNIRDITAIKETETKLIKAKELAEASGLKIKQQAEEIENFFNCAIDLLCIANTDGYFERLNQEWQNVLGYTLEELEGKRFLDFVHPDDVAATLQVISQLAGKSNILNFINRYRCKNGSYRWIEWRSYPFGNKIYAAARDITERKQIELEAILAKEKAEENDRLKTAFLQNMSHEIRTPMNAIMGFAGLMAENYDNREKLEQFSDIIEQRCYDLLAVINDILDISKIESGQSTLQLEECNINELFSELALLFADYQNRTDKQQIQLLIHNVLDEDIANIKTDQYKLKQILINLITNAFKFTESGRIECGCKLSSNQLLFYVSDTGVGIPGDKHEFIFERFTRIDTVISKSYVGGTGLGLPIVKGLVGLLGGKVWLESECNQGTTFYFTIDYQKIDVANPIPVSPADPIQHFTFNKNLLIVEDDPNSAMYLQELLTNYFSEIYVVGTGLEAIKLVHQQAVDLVLMDVQLPDISGYEATKVILQQMPQMKIIAQTAYAARDERLKAIDAGCVDYISKPTKREQLLSIISKHLKE